MNEAIKRKPTRAAMRIVQGIQDQMRASRDCFDWDDVLPVIDAEFAPLVTAAELAVQNFERCDTSGNDLGESDYEAWQALSTALAALEGV